MTDDASGESSVPAINECPECGHRIDMTMDCCPECGRPIDPADRGVV